MERSSSSPERVEDDELVDAVGELGQNSRRSSLRTMSSTSRIGIEPFPRPKPIFGLRDEELVPIFEVMMIRGS